MVGTALWASLRTGRTSVAAVVGTLNDAIFADVVCRLVAVRNVVLWRRGVVWIIAGVLAGVLALVVTVVLSRWGLGEGGSVCPVHPLGVRVRHCYLPVYTQEEYVDNLMTNL